MWMEAPVRFDGCRHRHAKVDAIRRQPKAGGFPVVLSDLDFRSPFSYDCCSRSRDKLWHRAVAISATDTSSFLFRLHDHNAAGWGRSACAISLADVAVKLGADAL